MVGVAGRSKGCLTCRTRKIRCDLGRPTCAQCRNAKRTCAGYIKTTTFLHKTSIGFDQHSRGTSDIALSIIQDLPNPTQQCSPSDKRSGEQDGHPDLKLSRLLDTTSFEQRQILLDFVSSTLPTSIYREGPLFWLESIPAQNDIKASLSLARSAISFGWTGHITASPNDIIRGRQAYLRSLSQLRRDLTVQEKASSQATIAAMSALVLYEMVEFGTYNAQGWLAHTAGIETIASHVTPHAFIAGPIHHVFLFYRTVIIVKSLIVRRRTFLAKESWRRIPWTWQTKTAFHQLLDLAAEATPLLESCVAYAKGPGTLGHNSVVANRLLVSVALMISRLDQWHITSNIQLPQGPPVLSKNGNINAILRSTSNIDTDYHWYPSRVPQDRPVPFDVLERARLMLFYWSVVLILQIEVFRNNQLCTDLAQHNPAPSTQQYNKDVNDDVRRILSVDSALRCADSILKWIEYATQPVWRSYGSIFMVFSLETIITWYSIYQELPRRWMSDGPDRSKNLQRSREILRTKVFSGNIRDPA